MQTTSPAAKAFFDALDAAEKDDSSSTTISTSTSKRKPQSDFVTKRIQTLGWRNRHSQDEWYPVKLKQPTTIEFSVRQVQRGEITGKYGTGATVWPASVVLLKYLEKHQERFLHGKRVIDLGAGTGVTSIAAALCGARQVVCTDGEENVVRLARDNIMAVVETGMANTDNQPTADEESMEDSASQLFSIHDASVSVQKYWWGTGVIRGGNSCDLVIVSDCVLPKLYPIAPLVDALDQLLTTPESVAVVSYEHRYYPEYDPRDKFLELATAKSLGVETVPMEEQDEVYSVDDIEIWLVQRKP